MKSLPTLAAAAALFTGFFSGFSAPARAEMVPFKTIGHWTLLSDETLCKARGEYADGTSLVFAINAKGVLVLGIENDAWEIPKGEYQITMQVDRAAPVSHTAKAGPGWVFWGVSLDEPNINLLSYGMMFHATIGYQAFHYRLDRSEAMLKALGQCAAPKIAAANPFSGSPPAATSKTPATTETPSNPFRRL
jgi:hypothetical protein